MKYYINRTTPTSLMYDALFNDVFGDMTRTHIPSVDVYETSNSYTVEADVAGYNDGDITLSVDKRVLTLESKELKKAEETEERKEERNYLIRENVRPEFKRSFTLPEDANVDSISAETKNGILTIVIPKKEKIEQGKIEIKIN